MTTLTMYQLQRRPVWRSPAVAPLPQSDDHWPQVAALFREDVVEARRMLVVGDPFEHALVDEMGQSLVEHVAGDTQAFLELIEPCHSHEGVTDDQQAPPLADDLEALADGAVHLPETGSLHDPSVVSCIKGLIHGRMSCLKQPTHGDGVRGHRCVGYETGEGIVDVAGSVALVTGANRGLGAAFCRALLDQGASKVYAGARDPDTIQAAGVIPVRLDITSPADVAAASAQCSDITLLVNNAGILTGTSVLADDVLEGGRREFETNVFGTLSMSSAFAPVLGVNGGGAIVNVLSVLSWLSVPAGALYCASKAAAWSLTNALRLELLDQDTQVVALHVGYMDTDMAAGVDAPKASPYDVASQALAAIEAGAFEVLADDTSRYVRSALSADLTALYPTLTSAPS